MSKEVNSLQASLDSLRQKVFGYESTLKNRINALHRECYDSRHLTSESINQQLPALSPSCINARDDIREEFRAILLRLGLLSDTFVDLENKLHKKREEYGRHCTSVHEYKVKISKLEDDLATQNAEGVRKAGSVTTLRSKLTEKEQQLAKCHSERDRFRNRFDAFESDPDSNHIREESAQKTKIIDQLNDQLSKKNATISEHQTQAVELKERLITVQKEVSVLRGKSKSSENNTGTERVAELITKFIDARTKDTEEAALIRTLTHANLKLQEQVREMSFTSTGLESGQQFGTQKTITSNNAQWPELPLLAANQALEIQELRSKLEFLRKRSSAKFQVRTYKCNSILQVVVSKAEGRWMKQGAISIPAAKTQPESLLDISTEISDLDPGDAETALGSLYFECESLNGNQDTGLRKMASTRQKVMRLLGGFGVDEE